MHVAESKEDDNVGDGDYGDVVDAAESATYADADVLCFFLSTAGIGGRLCRGVVDTGCVTGVDG